MCIKPKNVTRFRIALISALDLLKKADMALDGAINESDYRWPDLEIASDQAKMNIDRVHGLLADLSDIPDQDGGDNEKRD